MIGDNNDAKDGARAGENFVKGGGDITLINNFDWLKEQYECR
jgi:hypothetical protein